jgi:hypothetical protein
MSTNENAIKALQEKTKARTPDALTDEQLKTVVGGYDEEVIYIVRLVLCGQKLTPAQQKRVDEIGDDTMNNFLTSFKKNFTDLIPS